MSLSTQEGKEAVDERLLDLIVECQGRRMDDQRSSVVPPVVEVTAPKVLAADRRSVSAPDSPRGEEEREQAVRERPNFVRANGGRRRSSNGSHGSLDDIFDTLMSAQVSVWCARAVCVCVRVCACVCVHVCVCVCVCVVVTLCILKQPSL